MSKVPSNGLHRAFCAKVENTLKTHVNAVGYVKAESGGFGKNDLLVNYNDVFGNYTLAYHIPSRVAESLLPGVVNHVAHAFYVEICKRNGWPISWDGD